MTVYCNFAWARPKVHKTNDKSEAFHKEKQDVTYIEPFVGGGAMLFHMLQAHGNISRAVINDINPDLTACYETVRDRPDELIRSLASIQEDYYSVENEEACTCSRVVRNTGGLPAGAGNRQ